MTEILLTGQFEIKGKDKVEKQKKATSVFLTVNIAKAAELPQSIRIRTPHRFKIVSRLAILT